MASFGEIHPQSRWGADLRRAVMLEMDLDTLLDLKKSKVKFVPISRYPSVERDFAFIVDREQEADQIMEEITRQGKLNKENDVKNIEIFDVYTGEHVADNEKSIALTVTLQSDRQTLSEQDIAGIMQNIIQGVEKKFNARLRSA